jgi:hypothetical protein
MQIINIEKYNEIAETVRGYVAFQSTEEAIQEHVERHGYTPARVYVKITRGKRTVYCSLDAAK